MTTEEKQTCIAIGYSLSSIDLSEVVTEVADGAGPQVAMAMVALMRKMEAKLEIRKLTEYSVNESDVVDQF